MIIEPEVVWTYSFPLDTFADADYDTCNFSVTSTLPDWNTNGGVAITEPPGGTSSRAFTLGTPKDDDHVASTNISI
ncbi:hypothetical protein COB52_05505 [Candidatus Kaiserbacteria bacterium]|nr:MAG: hypothetical protein COB52_05505 [Candidatus Kaiserbacteria bacterium]